MGTSEGSASCKQNGVDLKTLDTSLMIMGRGAVLNLGTPYLHRVKFLRFRREMFTSVGV